jgi:hypothetical protein
MDFVDSVTPDDAKKIFTSEYPKTLQLINDDENHNTRKILQLAFLKGTAIVKYDKRYDDLIKGTKYSLLNTYKEDTLYRFALVDFYKVNPITKEQIRINMFKTNPDEIVPLLKKMGRIESPLMADFVVELPIQYMQMVENEFTRDILPIAYESSMNSIIEGGIRYNDFNLPAVQLNSTAEEDQPKITEYNNAVSAYRVRIAEANQVLLNAITMLLADEGEGSNLEVDPTATFSMLPAIYKTKAVFNINFDNLYTLKEFYEPYIAQLFNDIYEQCFQISSDIKTASNEK